MSSHGRGQIDVAQKLKGHNEEDAKIAKFIEITIKIVLLYQVKRKKSGS